MIDLTPDQRKAEIKCIKQELQTPKDFWKTINDEFKFQIDVCASEANRKCALYITKQQDALREDTPWVGKNSQRCWCNPGFSTVIPWHVKAHAEAQKHPGASVVLVGLPGASQEWYDFAFTHATEIRHCKDRINYVVPPEGIALDMKECGNSRESWVFIYRRKVYTAPAQVVLWDWRAQLRDASA